MYSPERETGPAKIFGPAFTVHMVLESDTAAPSPASHFVDSIPLGSVAFLSQPKGTYNSVWGGLMSTRAQILGCQGVVIDGYFRDINEQKDLGFPVCSAFPLRYLDFVLTHDDEAFCSRIFNRWFEHANAHLGYQCPSILSTPRPGRSDHNQPWRSHSRRCRWCGGNSSGTG